MDFMRIAMRTRPELPDSLPALGREPAVRFPPNPRSGPNPVSPHTRPNLLDRGLRHGEGEPIEGFREGLGVHDRSEVLPAMNAPVLPTGGFFASRAAGSRRRSRAALWFLHSGEACGLSRSVPSRDVLSLSRSEPCDTTTEPGSLPCGRPAGWTSDSYGVPPPIPSPLTNPCSFTLLSADAAQHAADHTGVT